MVEKSGIDNKSCDFEVHRLLIYFGQLGKDCIFRNIIKPGVIFIEQPIDQLRFDESTGDIPSNFFEL